MTRARLEQLIGGTEQDHGTADTPGWADRAESDRIDHVKSFGAVPVECGPDIAPAVARGPVRAVHLQQVYTRGDGELDAMPAGHKGRATLLVADVFDRMQAQASKKKSRIPLTASQIETARTYARTVERHAAGAVRCSSIEGRGGGTGGGPDGFTDARLASSRRIDLWHRRIGDGQAMAVKRVRKMARPGKVQRITITARQLVDAVCIEDMEISKVLRRYGWPANGRNVHACCVALGAILDRMSGPAPRAGIRAIRTDLPPDFWGR